MASELNHGSKISVILVGTTWQDEKAKWEKSSEQKKLNSVHGTVEHLKRGTVWALETDLLKSLNIKLPP